MKFIVINDDKGLAKMWAIHIEKAGHEVLLFEEPKEYTMAVFKDKKVGANSIAILLDRFYGHGFDLGNDIKLVEEIRKISSEAKLILCSKLHGDADERRTLPSARFDDILYPLPVNFDRLLFKIRD